MAKQIKQSNLFNRDVERYLSILGDSSESPDNTVIRKVWSILGIGTQPAVQIHEISALIEAYKRITFPEKLK